MGSRSESSAPAQSCEVHRRDANEVSSRNGWPGFSFDLSCPNRRADSPTFPRLGSQARSFAGLTLLPETNRTRESGIEAPAPQIHKVLSIAGRLLPGSRGVRKQVTMANRLRTR